jgi:hypothetical protein
MNLKPLIIAVAVLMTTRQVATAAPVVPMPKEFLGEWCKPKGDKTTPVTVPMFRLLG